jgi:hypothetical protein
MSPHEQNFVMAQAFDDEFGPVRGALDRAVLPILRGGSVDQSPWPTEPTGPARAGNFWQLDKPGDQVLADARAQAAQPSGQGAAPRPAASAEPQNGRSM